MQNFISRKIISISLVIVMALAVTTNPFWIDEVTAESEKASIDNCQIIAPEDIVYGETITVSAIGDRMERLDAFDPTEGETAYIPEYASIQEGYGYVTLHFAAPDYQDSFIPKYLGNYTIETQYREYKYNGSQWIKTNSIPRKTKKVHVKGIVSFDPNGGAVDAPDRTYRTDDKYGELPTPVRSGYVFIGWFNPYGTHVNSNYGMSFGSYNKYALTARWNKIYKVYLNANGGKVSPTTTEFVKDGKYGYLPTPTRSGYRFLGWFTSLSKKGDRVERGCYVDKNSDHTIYAHWQRLVTVKFDANKGNVSTKQRQIVYGDDYVLPKPTRSKYKFKGWYTKKVGGVEITEDDEVDNFNDHTLYAQWIGPKGKGKTVTNKEYKRIKKGLSQSDVKYIIGGSGRYLGKEKKVKYYFWNKKGSKKVIIVIGFKKGKVYAKSKFKI